MTHAKLKLSVMALMGLGLVSCASYQGIEENSEGFSQAIAHNKSVQEVAPTAAQKNNTFIPADANRQAIAREKYRENNVDEPDRVSTRN